MPDERGYSSEIAMFDMSSVIFHNTFKTTTPLVEATVNETLHVARLTDPIKQLRLAISSVTELAIRNKLRYRPDG